MDIDMDPLQVVVDPLDLGLDILEKKTIPK